MWDAAALSIDGDVGPRAVVDELRGSRAHFFARGFDCGLDGLSRWRFVAVVLPQPHKSRGRQARSRDPRPDGCRGLALQIVDGLGIHLHKDEKKKTRNLASNHVNH